MKSLKAGVNTSRGKNKDQYGRKFGRKQGDALVEFTKLLWLEDATNSMQQLLKMEIGQSAFHAFLKQEYAEQELEFILEVKKLEAMPPDQQMQFAPQLYKVMLSSAKGKGIGHQ
jgi:hypothetical protein